MPGDFAGTVTLVFTDIEGSTDLLQRLGDAPYADLLDAHRRTIREAFAQAGGREVSVHGDAVLAAFLSAREAVAATVAAQRSLRAHPWPAGTRLLVRMGVHTGEPMGIDGDYAGLDVHLASRICDSGHGGQILLSHVTATLVKEHLPPGISIRDLGAHQLKDLWDPVSLFQVMQADLDAEFPPPRSQGAAAHNLPHEVSSFVGRSREMAEVTRLLAGSRLLTLTGTGGCGKTRLALRVAREVAPAYRDGVWFVGLASLADPGLVVQTAASTLGVREVPGRPWLLTLTEALRGRALLIVLDNCEHVIDTAVRLVETLLGVCGGVRVLATSREPLRIPGEHTWRVPSLALPPHDAAANLVEALVASEAARLFVERAAEVQPGFALTPQTAPAVAETCRRLDGIPLALELAAARVAALPVQEIAVRLKDRFSLLVGGSRTALPRHQTLAAVIDWSYQLLSESERVLFRRLAVFAGGWTLEAAEAVCGDADGTAGGFTDLLAQLVMKSLVLMEEQAAGARYRFLETVREYGLARLRASGELAGTRDRHLDWYVALAERAGPELSGAAQAAWLDRLEREHDNLRAAMEWALESGRVGDGLRLIGAAWRFWYVRGYFAEGRGWVETLDRAAQEVPAKVRAEALKAAGNFAAFGQGDSPAARAFYDRSLGLVRETGDTRGVATVLGNLAWVAAGAGDAASERALLTESLALRREIGDEWGVALATHNLGKAAFRHGDYAAAGALLSESLAIWQRRGDKHYVAMAMTNLGYVASRQGDYERATALLREGLALSRELGDRVTIAYHLERFAGLAAAQGQSRLAARLFGAAEALRETIGAPLLPPDLPDYSRDVDTARAGASPEEFAAAWANGRAMTLDAAIEEVERA